MNKRIVLLMTAILMAVLYLLRKMTRRRTPPDTTMSIPRTAKD